MIVALDLEWDGYQSPYERYIQKTMLLNSHRLVVALLFSTLIGCSSNQSNTNNVCPVQADQFLQYVDIFDGLPEEMAILAPDNAQDTAGYWSLGYVYDAGRVVTVRCKYSGGAVVDITLSERVEKCAYDLAEKEPLSISCE